MFQTNEHPWSQISLKQEEQDYGVGKFLIQGPSVSVDEATILLDWASSEKKVESLLKFLFTFNCDKI